MSVSVLNNGHPTDVFGSDRVSNHHRNRAVDIWQVDGKTVAAQRGDDSNAVGQLMRYALSNGSTEVGGPWVVSSRGQSSFTNTIHQDHVHIGFD